MTLDDISVYIQKKLEEAQMYINIPDPNDKNHDGLVALLYGIIEDIDGKLNDILEEHHKKDAELSFMKDRLEASQKFASKIYDENNKLRQNVEILKNENSKLKDVEHENNKLKLKLDNMTHNKIFGELQAVKNTLIAKDIEIDDLKAALTECSKKQVDAEVTLNKIRNYIPTPQDVALVNSCTLEVLRGITLKNFGLLADRKSQLDSLAEQLRIEKTKGFEYTFKIKEMQDFKDKYKDEIKMANYRDQRIIDLEKENRELKKRNKELEDLNSINGYADQLLEILKLTAPAVNTSLNMINKRKGESASAYKDIDEDVLNRLIYDYSNNGHKITQEMRDYSGLSYNTISKRLKNI